jgi:hypothetical protein
MFKLFKSNEVKPVVPEPMTLEQVRQALVQLMADESSNHHRMGQLYNYVVDNKLAEKAGYKDSRAWFTQHLADLSQSALSMYGAVAEAFTEPVARRFGVTCLYLLTIYKEAAGLELNHEEPGNTPIEVPEKDGQVLTRPFSQCTVDQLRQALRRKRKPTSSKPLPAEAEVLAGQYRQAVTSRFPKGALIQVQVRNQKGKAVVDFKGIPLEQVARLAEALTAELPPVNELRLVEQVLPQA